MPKVGAEPIRKAALVRATITEIGRAGSLDVTVAQIAPIMPYVLLVLILAFRPMGLLGTRET